MMTFFTVLGMYVTVVFVIGVIGQFAWWLMNR